MVGIALGAHAGLAAAMFLRSTRKAAAVEKAAKEAPAKYVESAADARLFEDVFRQYTVEYLKGPMYWHKDKLQNRVVSTPGEPMFTNGRATSNIIGNLKS